MVPYTDTDTQTHRHKETGTRTQTVDRRARVLVAASVWCVKRNLDVSKETCERDVATSVCLPLIPQP